jgi:5-methylcytosine-specific restriction endonuclease McrA
VNGGATCPKCRQYTRLRHDGTMGEHRTEYYVMGQPRGGQRRARCNYAGVTPDEAEQGVTMVTKRVAEYHAAGGLDGLKARFAATGSGSIPRRTLAKKAQRPTGPDKLTVEAVIHRDRGQCAWCGDRVSGERGTGWSVQHRRPRRMGGDRRPDSNSPANLVLLCGSATTLCHLAAESQRAIAYDRGVLLRDNEVPTQRPVEHAAFGWIYLTDDAAITMAPPPINRDGVLDLGGYWDGAV